MIRVDAVVIGGGVLGCFAARNLSRWSVSTALVEKEPDVCTGITKANSAIVYAGYDNKPGSQKALMTVNGNSHFDTLCKELDVPFSRCGSLMVTYDKESLPDLHHKLETGIANGIPGLKLLSGQETIALEPMLRPGIAGALYAPSTGTVNPWSLGIAAYENAIHNGVIPFLNTCITDIQKTHDGYCLKSNQETILCKCVINCSGLWSDQVQELCFPRDIRLSWDGAEYLVLNRLAAKPGHIIFQQAQSCGKGITIIPCTEGNLLLSGIRKPLGIPFATTVEGIAALKATAQNILTVFDEAMVIRSFAAVRPNPYRINGEGLHDFCIENPAPGFYSLIGIKTPGLTCANELGMHLAGEIAAYLNAKPNPSFDPCRKRILQIEDSDIICQCEGITRSQVLEAIRRGASTLDGVKHRVGSGMGPCQGSRCSFAISRILEEQNHGTH